MIAGGLIVLVIVAFVRVLPKLTVKLTKEETAVFNPPPVEVEDEEELSLKRTRDGSAIYYSPKY